MRSPCPDESTLASYAAGRLDASALQGIERHLDQCVDCSGVVAILQRGMDTRPLRPEQRVAGDRLGRYEIQERVGAGGMGVVYRAFDPQLGRIVALKAVATSSEERAREMGRLRREAAAMAQLNHPNVVRVFDVVEAEGTLFIAMEFIEGYDLRQAVRGGPMPWREGVEVLLAAGEGIVAAHEAGIVHRDIKPGNILIARGGRVCVADFGLARNPGTSEPAAVADVAQSSDVTRTGAVAGTPAFMPPEARSGSIDPLGDQFSFCATAVHILTGRLVAREPDATSALPGQLRPVLERGLARAPGDRWPTMRALLDALEAAARRRARPWPLIVGGLLSVVALVVLPRDSGRCDDVEDLERLWSSERRAALSQRLESPGATDVSLALGAIDETVGEWRETLSRACEARTPADPCIRASFGRLRALLRELPEYATAETIGDTVLVMPTPGACEDAANVETRPPRFADALDTAVAQFQLARYEEALETLEGLRTDGELAWQGQWAARADLLAGRCLARMGRERDAYGFYEAAYAEALRVEDTYTAAVAAIKRSRNRRAGFGAIRESEHWLRNAEAAVASMGHHVPLEVQLHVIRSEVARRHGSRDRELQHLSDAVATLSPEVREQDRAEVVAKHAQLDATLHPSDATLSRAETALEAYRQAMGPEHPDALGALGALAGLYEELGRPERALGLYEDLVPKLEAASGPLSTNVHAANARLGRCYLAQHPPRVDEARAAFEHGLELLEASAQNEISRAYLWIGLSNTERTAGNLDAALELAVKAHVLAEEAVGLGHPLRASALLARAEGELARDRPDAAVELLQRALDESTSKRRPLNAALARAHLAQGSFAPALAAATEAAEAATGPLARAGARDSAARALAGLEDTVGARSMIEQAIADYDSVNPARAQASKAFRDALSLPNP